mgnify:CR=1 FL=1
MPALQGENKKGDLQKMKYKVGDRVRIVSTWSETYSLITSKKMDKWLGKIMTVRDVGNLSYKMVEDIKENKGIGWFWAEQCISGLACENKIVITTDGAETLARLYERNKIIKTATAKCAPDDKFSFETGAKIAFERLFDGEKKEKPKHFNGKVVCVGDFMGFTIGRIYEFVDGQCLDDAKVLRPVGSKCKDFSWCRSAFIPLVD